MIRIRKKLNGFRHCGKLNGMIWTFVASNKFLVKFFLSLLKGAFQKCVGVFRRIYVKNLQFYAIIHLPVWVRMWVIKVVFLVNPLWHILHWNLDGYFCFKIFGDWESFRDELGIEMLHELCGINLQFFSGSWGETGRIH